MNKTQLINEASVLASGSKQFGRFGKELGRVYLKWITEDSPLVRFDKAIKRNDLKKATKIMVENIEPLPFIKVIPKMRAIKKLKQIMRKGGLHTKEEIKEVERRARKIPKSVYKEIPHYGRFEGKHLENPAVREVKGNRGLFYFDPKDSTKRYIIQEIVDEKDPLSTLMHETAHELMWAPSATAPAYKTAQHKYAGLNPKYFVEKGAQATKPAEKTRLGLGYLLRKLGLPFTENNKPGLEDIDKYSRLKDLSYDLVTDLEATEQELLAEIFSALMTRDVEALEKIEKAGFVTELNLAKRLFNLWMRKANKPELVIE